MKRSGKRSLAVTGAASFTVWPSCTNATVCRRSAPCGAADTFLRSSGFSTHRTAYRPQAHSPPTEWKEVSMEKEERPVSPGLKWRNRRTGPPVPYWFAETKAVKAGYPVKSANLSTFADRPAVLVERAQRLQAEMLQWMAGKRDSKPHADGTFRSLIRLYETDRESPYNTDLKPGVRETYGVYIRRLLDHIGDLRIDLHDGRDVKRWFHEWRFDPDGRDRLPRARMVLAVLKAANTFGVGCRLPSCKAF